MNIVSRVLFKQRSLVRKTHRDVFSHSNYRQQDASCFHSYWLVREKTTYQATHSAHQLKTSCIWNVYIGGLRMRLEADVCVDNFISLNTAWLEIFRGVTMCFVLKLRINEYFLRLLTQEEQASKFAQMDIFLQHWIFEYWMPTSNKLKKTVLLRTQLLISNTLHTKSLLHLKREFKMQSFVLKSVKRIVYKNLSTDTGELTRRTF